MVITGCMLFFLLTASHDAIQPDLRFINDVNPVYQEPIRQKRSSGFSFRQTNEVKLAFTGMIRLYQIFVSPQGPPSCNFTVTCSQFLSRAVRRYGFIHGVLMGADRLTRCTHGTRQLYTIDPATEKAIDHSIDAYYLFSRSRIHTTASSTPSPLSRAGREGSTHTSSSPTGGKELHKGGSK